MLRIPTTARKTVFALLLATSLVTVSCGDDKKDGDAKEPEVTTEPAPAPAPAGGDTGVNTVRPVVPVNRTDSPAAPAPAPSN